MGLYRSADHAMRVYLALYANLPRGFDPFAMRSRLYADKCPVCRTVGKWRQQDGAWYCAASRCGAARPWRPAGVMKGFFQEGRARISGRRVQMKPSARQRRSTVADVLADLGQVWVVLTPDQYRVLRARQQYRALLSALRQLDPEGGWTAWRVRRTLREARKAAEARMVRIGLMGAEDMAA